MIGRQWRNFLATISQPRWFPVQLLKAAAVSFTLEVENKLELVIRDLVLPLLFFHHFLSPLYQSPSALAEHPDSSAHLFSFISRLLFPWTLSSGQAVLLTIFDKLCASLLFCLSAISLLCLCSSQFPHLRYSQSFLAQIQLSSQFQAVSLCSSSYFFSTFMPSGGPVLGVFVSYLHARLDSLRG